MTLKTLIFHTPIMKLVIKKSDKYDSSVEEIKNYLESSCWLFSLFFGLLPGKSKKCAKKYLKEIVSMFKKKQI